MGSELAIWGKVHGDFELGTENWSLAVYGRG